jgi:tetratricopeptide (TPR) repeat protein
LFFLFPLISGAQTDEDRRAEAIRVHQQGNDLYDRGEFQQAAVAFRRAQELAPAPTNLYNLARCDQQLGLLEEALEIIEQYISLPNLSQETRVAGQEVEASIRSQQRGHQLFQRQNFEDAATSFRRAQELAPVSSNLYHLAQCLLELDRPAEALDLIRQYLDAPNLPPEGLTIGRELQASIQARIEENQTPTPCPEPPEELAPNRRRAFGAWGLLTAGLAMGVMGGVLDFLALQSADGVVRFQDLDEYQAWRDEVEGTALAGDVLLGIGAAAAVGGLIWLLIELVSRPGRGARTSNALGLSVTPVGSIMLFESSP